MSKPCKISFQARVWCSHLSRNLWCFANRVVKHVCVWPACRKVSFLEKWASQAKKAWVSIYLSITPILQLRSNEAKRSFLRICPGCSSENWTKKKWHLTCRKCGSSSSLCFSLSSQFFWVTKFVWMKGIHHWGTKSLWQIVQWSLLENSLVGKTYTQKKHKKLYL